MAETLLTVTPQIADMDVGQSQVLNIQTNAADFELVFDKPELMTFDKQTKTITAVKEGVVKITVSATVADATTKKVEWYCNIAVIETTLEVKNQPTELYLGQEARVEIVTNASDFNIMSSDPTVMLVDKKTKSITAISMGKANITVSATKLASIEKTVTWEVVCSKTKPVEDEGTPVVLTLTNSDTGRVVKILTSDNESLKDVTLELPSVSGQLMVQEQLKDEIRMIEQPMIITPANGVKNWQKAVRSSPYATLLGYEGAHEYSVWQVSLTEDFSNIIEEYKTVGHDLTEINFSRIGEVYIRVKYGSYGYESAWSETLNVELGTIDIESADLTAVIHEVEDSDFKYYGEVGLKYIVGIPKCLQDVASWPKDAAGIKDLTLNTLKTATQADRQVRFRDYIGPLSERKRVYKTDYYTNAAEVPTRFKMLANTQMTHDGKLYYALKDLAPATADEIILPGTDGFDAQWALDERNNLCTYTELMEKLRFCMWHNNELTETVVHTAGPTPTALVAQDNMSDGKSLGIARYCPPTMANPITNIGSMIEDQHYTYLKYWYRGRLCYTFKNPICWDVAWNDLAKLELVYGERTVRIGTNLYRIRLMTEKEYNLLFRLLLSNNIFTKHQLGIYDSDNPLTTGICTQWIHDTQEGAVRNAMTGVDTKVALDPKTRQKTNGSDPYNSGAYRPVLEYIPEHAAPYNNMSLHFHGCPNITNSIKYDKWSDCGYFGGSTNNDLVSYTNICTHVALTAGTLQNEGANWLNFYWHGMVTYFSTKTPRYNISAQAIMDAQAFWGYDLGGSGKKTITINGVNYRIAVPFNTKWSPYESNAYTKADIGSNHVKIPVTSAIIENGRYAQYSELLLRLSKGYTGWEEVNGAGTEPRWDGGYMGRLQSVQRGENWAEYESKDLCINYASAGNGTATWGRNIGNGVVADSGYYGGSDWYGDSAFGYATDYAWRCLLNSFSQVITVD